MKVRELKGFMVLYQQPVIWRRLEFKYLIQEMFLQLDTFIFPHHLLLIYAFSGTQPWF